MVNFLHAANVIQFACYTVRDILWLRLLAIAAAALLIPYYYAHFEVGPQWPSVLWASLFITMNSFHVVWLIRDRRPPRLTEEQQQLYEDAFQCVKPNQMLKLIGHAQFHELQPDEVLVEQGVSLNNLMLIVTGRAAVRVDGANVTTIGAGDFVGEMSYLRRSETNAQVRALTPVRCLRWERTRLRRFLDRHPQLSFAMQNVIGMNLVQKLSAMAPPGSDVVDRGNAEQSENP